MCRWRNNQLNQLEMESAVLHNGLCGITPPPFGGRAVQRVGPWLDLGHLIRRQRDPRSAVYLQTWAQKGLFAATGARVLAAGVCRMVSLLLTPPAA